MNISAIFIDALWKVKRATTHFLLSWRKRMSRKKKSAPGGREREVATLISQGKTNRAIAEQFVVSERTVETHLRNSYARLGLRSRVTLARWAAENAQT